MHLARLHLLKRRRKLAEAFRPRNRNVVSAQDRAMDSLSLFLSYNSVDRLSVVAIKKLLEARGIHDIHAAHPSPTTTGALERIGALYRIEDEIRGRPAEERRTIRQTRAAPLLEELRAWMEKMLRSLYRSRTQPRPFAMHSRAGVPSRYVDDGRIEIDNSAAEPALRAVALGRRIIFSVVRMEAARTRPPSIHCSERRSSTELIPNCGCGKC